MGQDASLVVLSDRSQRATRDAIQALRHQPEVALVEPNYIRRPFLKPNDTNYPLQWNIRKVRLEQAWDTTTGSASVVVAVVDSGILKGHPDLQGRLLPGYDFIADAANAGDGNGRDSDPTDNGTDSLSSSAFHGTHVAGIIGAASNNSKGIVGADWKCKVLPVRALGIQAGKGKDSDIADAIRWAAGVAVSGVPSNTHPARVINLSFGGPGASTTLTKAVQEAQKKGAIVVAAAGNHGQEGSNIYPAAIAGIVTVGAIQYDGKRASYSNYGKVVDIMAPGGNMSQNLPYKFNNKDYPAGVLGTLYSTTQKKYTYHFFEGTSQAAPLVAGIVSLMLTINATLDEVEALKILKKTAHVNTTCTEGCGAGLVNAEAAVKSTGGSGGGTKLPFSKSCVNDAQCSQGVCRDVNGTGSICTQFCSIDATCPGTGSKCNNGLCSPSAVTNNNVPSGTTVWGGGCSLTPARALSAWLVLGPLGLLGILAWARRRRARRPGRRGNSATLPSPPQR